MADRGGDEEAILWTSGDDTLARLGMEYFPTAPDTRSDAGAAGGMALIAADVVVQYRVRDLIAFLAGSSAPREAITVIAQQEASRYFASRNLDDLLTAGRTELLPGTLDLLTYDPLAQASGNATALAVQKLAVQLAIVATLSGDQAGAMEGVAAKVLLESHMLRLLAAPNPVAIVALMAERGVRHGQLNLISVERGEAHFKYIWAESLPVERRVLLALAYLLNGGLPAMQTVRRLLDARRAG